MKSNRCEKDEEPKCPECGAGVLRPKCLFELGAFCPRHPIAFEYRQKLREDARKLQKANMKGKL